MQAGYQPATARTAGTPLEGAPQQSPAAARWSGSFAAENFRRTMEDPDIAFDEREGSFRRFRPVLVGGNLDRVPTGGFSTASTFVIPALDPEDSIVRPAQYATFLQPGAPGREPVRPPGIPEEGPPTAAGPGRETVFRQPDPDKLRPDTGFMSVARWQQQEEASKRKQARVYGELFGAAAGAAAVAPGGDGPVGPSLPPPSFPSPLPPPSASSQPPGPVPNIQTFAKGLGQLMSGQMSSQGASSFAAQNALWFTCLGLLLALLVLLIVMASLSFKKQ